MFALQLVYHTAASKKIKRYQKKFKTDKRTKLSGTVILLDLCAVQLHTSSSAPKMKQNANFIAYLIYDNRPKTRVILLTFRRPLEEEKIPRDVDFLCVCARTRASTLCALCVYVTSFRPLVHRRCCCRLVTFFILRVFCSFTLYFVLLFSLPLAIFDLNIYNARIIVLGPVFCLFFIFAFWFS